MSNYPRGTGSPWKRLRRTRPNSFWEELQEQAANRGSEFEQLSENVPPGPWSRLHYRFDVSPWAKIHCHLDEVPHA